MARVVVTGLGAICALGHNQNQFWQGLLAGKSGIREISVFDAGKQRTQLAGEVPDFNPQKIFNSHMRKRLSRCDELALVAGEEALKQAGLNQSLNRPEILPSRFGVILGAGAGGSRNGEIFYRQYKEEGNLKPWPSLFCAYAPSCTTDALASHFQIRGPRCTIVTACSSSNTAIGYAAQLIRSGKLDLVLTGGSDALSELTYTGFNALKAISSAPCRPFDRDRNGLNIGEAAGILVLESLEHAQQRNQAILGEFLGYGLISETYHMTAPDPSGKGAAQAMKRALQDADLSAEKIGYVSAHGTATRHNDLAESKALCDVFGLTEGFCPVPVSSLKSMIGHCLGAAGAIEAVGLVLSLKHQTLPPTMNHLNTDPECPVDCIPNKARKKSFRYAMSNSFAFGGNNTAIIFGQYPL